MITLTIMASILIVLGIYELVHLVVKKHDELKGKKSFSSNEKVWLARDRDGSLFSYTSKPYKRENYWNGKDPVLILNSLEAYAFIEWEDEHPMLVSVERSVL